MALGSSPKRPIVRLSAGLLTITRERDANRGKWPFLGLARSCQEGLSHDPFSGRAFVFGNRRPTALKLLVHHRARALAGSQTALDRSVPLVADQQDGSLQDAGSAPASGAPLGGPSRSGLGGAPVAAGRSSGLAGTMPKITRFGLAPWTRSCYSGAVLSHSPSPAVARPRAFRHSLVYIRRHGGPRRLDRKPALPGQRPVLHHPASTSARTFV